MHSLPYNIGLKLKLLKTTTRFLLVLAFAGASLFAQSVSLGFKGGVPLTEQFNIGQGPNAYYNSADRRYLVGPTAQLNMGGHFALEIDAIFKRLGYEFATPNANSSGALSRSTVANQWEFPLLLKYSFAARGSHQVRPFIDVGASLRHLSSFRQTTYASQFFAPQINNNAIELAHRNSPGAVAGIGITFQVGKLKISPEARYTRWANQAFQSSDGLLKTNLDQGDFLVGFTF